ncbi:MAG: hypothetical protein KGL39_13330 [Patescibacteria group bacterium]|nr:hypothetical protein [Patescibacteria group bacterium]
MSVQANISITSDNATPAIARIIDRTKPARLAQVCRQPLETFWRIYLNNYPRLPGKFAAFPDTGFGERASRGVIGFAEDNGVRLEARAQGLRLRYMGGTIRPVNKKALCFGVTPEAYGKTVYDFGYVAGKKDKATNDRLRANFAFARSITFAANPAVVPTQDEFAEVAMAAIQRSLN